MWEAKSNDLRGNRTCGTTRHLHAPHSNYAIRLETENVKTPSLRLTRRQHDVLMALNDELSRKATTARLQISVYTVDDHLAELRRIFKVATNPAVIGAAIEAGIIPQLSIPRKTGEPPLVEADP